ncbi:MAG: ABC transporter ATP-binding protein [Hyphomicrobiales bacterium]|nr:ABC transporter ATP-binding protein [Hyphomicrobiales bacterium]
MAEIALDGVSHRFGALDVLVDVSFSVGAGEIAAIVGPSGCGKSTLLSIAGGLLQPSAGSVRAGGFPAASLNPLTFVFQDFALLPWRDVAGNVALALEHRALSPHETKTIVADVLARTGLSDFAAALPKQLSGGMRQRVGLARALAVRPAVLLMDEPLSALDSQTRDLLMDDLSRLLEDGDMSVLYVTHNLDEAVRLADRAIVFSRRPGRIRAISQAPVPRAKRRDPAHAETLARWRADLWDMIRGEAAEAERETVAERAP